MIEFANGTAVVTSGVSIGLAEDDGRYPVSFKIEFTLHGHGPVFLKQLDLEDLDLWDAHGLPMLTQLKIGLDRRLEGLDMALWEHDNSPARLDCQVDLSRATIHGAEGRTLVLGAKAETFAPEQWIAGALPLLAGGVRLGASLEETQATI